MEIFLAADFLVTIFFVVLSGFLSRKLKSKNCELESLKAENKRRDIHLANLNSDHHAACDERDALKALVQAANASARELDHKTRSHVLDEIESSVKRAYGK